MIRVAIADDSPFTCKLLASYIEEGGDCEVVGVAHDARSTVDLVKSAAPDVLTLDLQMPGGNGLDLLREITEGPPISVVVISGITRLAAATTLHALELGAVDFVLKFTPGAPVSRASLKREILTKVKLAASARPTRRRPAITPLVADARLSIKTFRPPVAANNLGAVVIGASTGGPTAISELLQHLPRDFATPCIVVQHLPATFTAPFAAQLGRHARVAVKEAEPGDRLVPGRVLVTPGSSHLLVRPGGLIELRPATDEDVYRPSIDLTMISAAESCGTSAVGVLLTGMGHDGAEGLKRIRDAGGDTYVQDLASCVVTSMPERAIGLGAADHIARPDRIGQMLAGRSKS
jgi:two-component system chemotaxis response regulator CheB